MSSELTPLLLLVILLVVFWLVVLRPARTQQRNQQALQRSLEVGEDVVLSSGIFGTVTDIDDAQVGLEIAPGTVIRVARQVVVRRVEDAAVADSTAAAEPQTKDDERPEIFTAAPAEPAGPTETDGAPLATDPEIAPHEVSADDAVASDPVTKPAGAKKTAKKTSAKKAAAKKAPAKKASDAKAGAAGDDGSAVDPVAGETDQTDQGAPRG